jgi:uncharacterized membrane protein YhaH (DUF805 family)
MAEAGQVVAEAQVMPYVRRGKEVPMSFADAVRTCFTKYAEFKGRAGRPEYWWFFLSYLIAYSVVLIIASWLKASWLASIVALAYLIPLLAAAVRRLHDTGRSGWWYLIGLIPIVGTIILIVLLAQEGNPASNEYGPPPGMTALPGAGTTPPPPPPPA